MRGVGRWLAQEVPTRHRTFVLALPPHPNKTQSGRLSCPQLPRVVSPFPEEEGEEQLKKDRTGFKPRTLWAQNHLMVSYHLVSLSRAGAPDRRGSFSKVKIARNEKRAAIQTRSHEDTEFPLTTLQAPLLCRSDRAPQASAFDWDRPRPGRDRTHTCGPGPPSHPKKCHLQMG